MQYSEADFNELIREVKGRFFEMGARSKQNFHESVDQILEEKRRSGTLSDDFDIQGMKDKLRMEWRDMEVKGEV